MSLGCQYCQPGITFNLFKLHCVGLLDMLYTFVIINVVCETQNSVLLTVIIFYF